MTDLTALKQANAARWANPTISHSQVLESLSYNLETGEFHRTAKTANAIKIGQIAGWVNPNGYRYIELLGIRLLAHRLAWFYVTAQWPEAEIDHINCKPDDNRWTNLRQASRRQNSHNTRKKSANTSGFKGVSFAKRERLFTAKIRHNGKRLSLGYHKTALSAHQAYSAKAVELYGDFGRHS